MRSRSPPTRADAPRGGAAADRGRRTELFALTPVQRNLEEVFLAITQDEEPGDA